MRTGIRVTSFQAPNATARAKIHSVTTSAFRDVWFRCSVSAGTYTLRCYATKADATAATGELASGTSTGGTPASVTMTVTAGGAFNPTPMTVSVDLAGAWTNTLVLGYVAAISSELVDQMIVVLGRYAAANEALASLGVTLPKIVKGLQTPSGIGLCVVTRGESPEALIGGPFDAVQVDVDLVAFDDGADAGVAQARMASLAGALRSIAEEQRTWGWGDPNDQGGPVLGTDVRGAIESGPVQEGGALYHRCTVPLRVDVRLFADAVAPAGAGGAGAGGGGKYGDPDIP